MLPLGYVLSLVNPTNRPMIIAHYVESVTFLLQ
jgi:hypothetical protein